MRNKEMTILKALGIILVVIGHKYDFFRWFPTYSFHMALFFFISGYFYNERNEYNIIEYIKKKIKKTIPIYFIFNLFYMILTYILFKKYGFLLGNLPTLKSFFIIPFINGHQSLLFVSAWFIIALLIVQIIFVVLYRYIKLLTINREVHFLIFLLIGILSTCIAKYFKFSNISILLIVIRTCFGLFFYYLGFYYKKNEWRQIFSYYKLLIIFIVQIILVKISNDVKYILVWGNFNGNIITPIITSINGIYIYLFISKKLSNFFNENNLLYRIGNHTASVMFHHLFIFLVINYVILKFTNGDIGQLSDIWFSYKLEKYWFIYVILGVLIPVYLAEYYWKIKKIFKNKK